MLHARKLTDSLSCTGNKMTLTIYILDVEQGDKLRAIRSCPQGLDIFFMVTKNHDFSQMPGTDWKMYLYSDEWLQEELSEAIPTFLKMGEMFDFYALYKRYSKEKFFHAPRIFKSNIPMKTEALMPASFEGLRGETILNGFLEG